MCAGRRAIRTPRDTLLYASRDARFCAPRARRSARRERAVLRAVSAPFSAPGARRSARSDTRRSARRKTRRSARRKTRRLHIVRRAAARHGRAGCAQRAHAGPVGLTLLALRGIRKQREAHREYATVRSQARACARTYYCREFLGSEVVAKGVGNFSPKPNNI